MRESKSAFALSHCPLSTATWQGVCALRNPRKTLWQSIRLFVKKFLSPSRLLFVGGDSAVMRAKLHSLHIKIDSRVQVVLRYFGATKEYVKVGSIHWPNGMPNDLPPCGFDGAGCPGNVSSLSPFSLIDSQKAFCQLTNLTAAYRATIAKAR